MELRTALRNDPGEVERARNLVADSMRRWGVPDDGGVAALLVSELVTNALRYGAQPMRMIARKSETSFRIEVHDARGGEPPRLRRGIPDSSNGRGMMLVDALAARWGWSEFAGDKLVWFELDTHVAHDVASGGAHDGAHDRADDAPTAPMPALQKDVSTAA